MWLSTLSQLTRSYSFETAVKVLEEGFRMNRTGFCNAAGFGRPDAELRPGYPSEQDPNLAPYDYLLKAGG